MGTMRRSPRGVMPTLMGAAISTTARKSGSSFGVTGCRSMVTGLLVPAGVYTRPRRLDRSPAPGYSHPSMSSRRARFQATRSSRSKKTDADPILSAIVRTAARLCDASYCHLYLVDGGFLRNVAKHGWLARSVPVGGGFPIGRGSVAGRAVHDRRTVHVRDLKVARRQFENAVSVQRAAGLRTMLATPLLRDGQATIALENARLSRELEARNRELTEALGRETATGEILGVISRSPTDIEPVLSAVAESAARLCHAYDVTVFRLDGDVLRLAAHHGPVPVTPELSLPVNRSTIGGRTVVEVRTIQVADAQADDGEFPLAVPFARQFGHRTLLSVPLIREGVAVGVIQLRRTEVVPFTDQQITLLQTFADQAVIAIENVRLFTELQARNHELTEALEQQTATADILRAISSSPTDLRPVLETVVHAAARFCDAPDVAIVRVDGDVLRGAAASGSFGEEMVRRAGSIEGVEFPISRASVTGRAVVERRSVHVHDLAAEPEDEYPVGRELQRRFGHRTLLATPLLREGVPVGALVMFRTEINPFSEKQARLSQIFADQAVIAIENVRLFTELEARNQELTDSLTQQTATAEILRVISSSPTDIQPVLEAVTASAARLCEAPDAAIFLAEGEELRLATHLGPIALGPIGEFAVPLVRGSLTGRSTLERRTIQLADHQAEEAEYPEGTAVARRLGVRTMLTVPLLRSGEAIGVIALRRTEVRLFTDQQIALLQTFADQAVIAIENVRLFRELGERNRDLLEALDQQTATSEILRVISQSQTDVQPVFDTIARSAVQLCDGAHSGVYQLDGDQIRMVANHGMRLEALVEFARVYPRRLSEATGPVGRAIRDGATLHIADVREEPTLPEYTRRISNVLGYRTQLAVPMMRQGVCIGAISIVRSEVRPFSESIITLIQTFADQAVIAIENARLLTELRTKNSDLTESLDQQTATSEILRVISQSPTDVQPVFDAIARNARRLCDTSSASVLMLDGTMIRLAAVDNENTDAVEALRNAQRAFYPSPMTPRSAGGRAILTGRTIHIPDVLDDPDYEFAGLQQLGLRSVLCVPMLRHGAAIGAITVHTWETPRPFGTKQVELLQTFADQAVIAVENARLFRELEERTAELTRSVEQLTALGEISHAVSSTLDVETVLQTVVSRASQLAGSDGGSIYEYDDATQEFHIRATHNLDPTLVAALRTSPLHRGEGAMGRAAETREPVQIADIQVGGAYQSHIRDTLLGAGYRALLSVPLLREDQIIGSLSLNRKTPGEFSAEAVEVLKTFATQSALAIENARLFREIEVKSRQLEAASQHKSEFLANMSHELRTPLNAIIGFSEVLNERMFGDLNEKQDEYLKDIHASGQHLLSLINDILDLSKIEAGRMELELTDFHLPSAIDSALTLVRERATRRGIVLQPAVDGGVGQLRADERKVRQVLLNLLSNAIKFTPEGGRIEVRAVRENDAVAVSVSDTGIGIAPEDQEAIFEEFRQVGTADKK